jgi:hypothetical protein
MKKKINKWWNWQGNRPSTYRRLAGYCAPEMFCDPDGLYLFEMEGMLWFRNRNAVQPNDSMADVIATIPQSQVLQAYQLLQDYLNSKGVLDEKNELEAEELESSGFNDNTLKHGLTL